MTSLSCAGKYLDLSMPCVMGILNITPNSFSAVGRFQSVDQAVNHAKQMVADGAAIIDVGGEPTNPGVHPVVSLQEELERVIPVITALARELSVPISIDTSKPEVMREAVLAGAGFINDVRALREPGALEVALQLGAAICIMHMSFPYGKDVAVAADPLGVFPIDSVSEFLQQRLEICESAGIPRSQIVIDPGIGSGNFGKDLQQNLQLLAHLHKFRKLGVPILVGVSRKMFIGELLDLPAEERLYGSLAAAAIAVNNGASIIRAHDVKATVEAIKVAGAISCAVNTYLPAQ
ncbi:MAG TPA: dihydropteroate synthase [Gammaproteobacteria bacterium]|nr:dihydropteroate synthase [Gammaproteobacteria bacterium]